ncbi:MAG: putative ABC transporter permease [Clostridia bacterium]|nr:putative ABC transporter permease [Clostridia bacterium]MBR6478981.1 putative ABC transporter permease [Clostridia bacterium]MBR6513010.1 putative ABC transporter permease [Clostridia bacterium]
MIISRYVCLFFIYSFLGWVYESIYCTIKTRRWQNRGFLYGPIIPIYGFGAVIISIFVNVAADNRVTTPVWKVFLVSMIGSAILEFATSWGLEKIFHARWWDYSSWPLNLDGRISLFTSMGFGLAGVLIIYAIKPIAEGLMDNVPPLATEVLALAFIMLLAADFTTIINDLKHFNKVVLHYRDMFDESVGSIVDATVQQTEEIKEMTSGVVRKVRRFSDSDEKMKLLKNYAVSLFERK